MHLYGARQDLLSDAFSGKGQGPGLAEMEFAERKSEPVLIFMADKTSAGAWNLPLYKMFADPVTTLVVFAMITCLAGFLNRVRLRHCHPTVSPPGCSIIPDVALLAEWPAHETVRFHSSSPTCPRRML